jgi:hypothetical protein
VSPPETVPTAAPAELTPAPSETEPPAAPATPIAAMDPKGLPHAHRQRRFFAGTDGYASFGTGPSVTAGGAIVIGARISLLSTGLEMRFDAPASTTVQGGSVTSWLYAGSVVPCLHYLFGSLCAVGTLGSLQGWAEARVSTPRSTLFAALGGRLGAEWAITEAFALRGHVDLQRNLAPTTLSIDSSGWTASSLAFLMGAGLFVRFP